MALSLVLYYVLTRLIVIPLGKGGYDRFQAKREPVASAGVEADART